MKIISVPSARRIKTFSRRAPLDRRQSILDAARTILESREYYEVTMDDIATRAGVAKGSLYLYFPTKENLFQRVIEDMHRRLRLRWEEALASTPAGPDRLKALIGVQLDYFEENRGLFLQVFQGRLPQLCGGKQKAQGMINQLLDIYSATLKECVDIHFFRPVDVRSAAMALFGMVRGFAFIHITQGLSGPLKNRVNFIWDLLEKGWKR